MSTAVRNDQISTSQGQFTSARTITADGELIKNPILAPAKVGQLTTRTSSSVGELTMNAGHGFTTGARLDIYWLKTDGTYGHRYGVTIGTVTGNAIPISAGAGDNLPDNLTAITAMVPQLEVFPYDKDDIVAFVGACQYPATIVVRSAVPANLVVATPNGAGSSYIWDGASGVTSPFSADTADVYLSHGSPDFSAAVIALALVN